MKKNAKDYFDVFFINKTAYSGMIRYNVNCKISMEIAQKVDNEIGWYEQLKSKASNWLVT